MHRSLELDPYITYIASKPKAHNDIMRFSVLGFKCDTKCIRIELQAPVIHERSFYASVRFVASKYENSTQDMI